MSTIDLVIDHHATLHHNSIIVYLMHCVLLAACCQDALSDDISGFSAVFLIHCVGKTTESLYFSIPIPSSHKDLMSCSDNNIEVVTRKNNDSLKLITLNSELQYSTVLHFVSAAFPSTQELDPTGGPVCSEVAAVVGDLDSKTAC